MSVAQWFATPDFEYHEANHEGAAMTVRHMRLTIGLFFLIAGVAVLFVRFFMPDVAPNLDRTRMMLGGFLALALAGWNLSKWYAGWMAFQQQATPVRRPLQPDPTASADREYNPEFDFEKKDNKP